MSILSSAKIIDFLKNNKKHLSDWHMKFLEDIEKQISVNNVITPKQFNVLIKEAQRVHFINSIELFE